MRFNGLVSSGLNHEATRSAGDLAGIAGARARMDNTGTARERFDARCHRPGAGANTDVHAEARLAERTRIAQELHDTLLQGFFALSMQLQGAVNLLPEDSAAKPRFNDLVQLFDRVLEQGRLAVQGLRSSDDHLPSLGQAFAGVPSELGLPSAVGFRVVVEGRERVLSASPRDEVYLIGREAIVNAYRHSQAKHIETEIEYRSAELRIAVRDNGCGIDPRELKWGRSGHWGLQGMRERAERIGARLRVLSRVALGTEVELCVPGRIAFEQAEVRGAC